MLRLPFLTLVGLALVGFLLTASAMAEDVGATELPVATPMDDTSAKNLDALPSYTYDPALDPRRLPYATPHVNEASAAPIELGTRTGWDVGVQGSWYRYQEHLVADHTFMHIDGPVFGATVTGVQTYDSGFFMGLDFRTAYGRNKYTGAYTSGGVTTPYQHDQDNWLFESRLLAGQDFILGDTLGFSPYAGLGFRYLFNDPNGGIGGYQRYSHYVYLPVGLTERFRLTDDMRVSLNTEFDHLIYGWQTSQIGDALPGFANLNNAQRHGYGARASLMFEQADWAFGPYVTYWNINQSASGTAVNGAGSLTGLEPHNQTIEYGAQVKYFLGAF